MLKGKQGRFRQNLLGKRVDYSGRSVIVVGPTLKLHQCGLPKQMALELFKPFVMKRLVDLELAQNIKSAKRMVERRRAQVWDVLEEVIKEHPVFLNRAPTLHRLGIQAFEPVLVEGKAIQIHPLVCTAFNADFDGDQMAVHLPLSAEAQAEARILMLSANNILSPATGRPIVTPTQDMVFGAYYLTVIKRRGQGRGPGLPPPLRGRAGLRGRRRRAAGQGHLAGTADVAGRAARRSARTNPPTRASRPRPDGSSSTRRCRTTSPSSTTSSASATAAIGSIVEVLADRLPTGGGGRQPRQDQGPVLPLRHPVGSDHLDRRRQDAAEQGGHHRQVTRPRPRRPRAQFKRGIITDDERRQKEIEIWTSANSEVGKAMEETLRKIAFNPLDMMVDSGARGNPQQVRQIAGMKGLVSNPRGEMIPRPILSSFREGLSVLEYFISTHGARKGLADTALRTADSGYLTRRLVDVAQELIIREEDCGTTRGVWIRDIHGDDERARSYLETRLDGRVLVRPVTLSDGTVLRAGNRHLARGHGRAARRSADRPRSCAVRSSPVRPSTGCAASATAVRWPPTGPSSSARRSASSPPSRSVSPARS